MITPEIKTHVITYIFSILKLSEFRYKLINSIDELQTFKEHKFYLLANHFGINSLLVFMKINGKNNVYTVDRRTLYYSINKVSNINTDEIKIYPVKINYSDDDLFNGTIFDGMYININKKFIINDVYYFKGKDMSSQNFYYKMLNIISYLTNKQNDFIFDNANNLNIVVNKINELSEIKQVVNEHLQNKNIKGLILQPDVSTATPKLIYIYKQTDITNEPDETHDKLKPHTANDIKKINMIFNDDDILTLRIKKTTIADVYKLYAIHKSDIDTNNVCIRFLKIDIAYIPDIKTSTLCYQATQHNSTILMDCKYIKDKNKWLPISINDTEKYPSEIK